MHISAGNLTFSVDHHWAQIPPHIRLGTTHAIVQDYSGRIYVGNLGSHAVLVFAPDGQFLAAWGEAYAENIHGLCLADISNTECLFIAHSYAGFVSLHALDGRELLRLPPPPRPDLYPPGRPYCPTSVAVAPDGTIYVADGYGASFIHAFESDGRYGFSFGGLGAEPGQLDCPHGIAIDPRGLAPRLAVANRANLRIDRFDLDGNFLQTIVHPDLLRRPCGMQFYNGDMVVPELYGRVAIFGPDHALKGYLGDTLPGVTDLKREDLFSTPPRFPALTGFPNVAAESILPGKFIAPHDLHVDPAGNIYVAEWLETGRLTKLTRIHG